MICHLRYRRFLPVLIFLSGWGLSVDNPVWSQSEQSQPVQPQPAQPQTESPAPAPTESDNGAEGAAADPRNTPPTDDPSVSEEFDKLILGPWVLLAENAAKPPGKEGLRAAISRCITNPGINRLDVEEGAARKLPDPRHLFGDMVYYRTDKGLQRFDLKSGSILLFSEQEKMEPATNKTFWLIKGKKLRFALRFADTKKRGGKGEFMVENTKLYLKCPLLSKNSTAPDQ